MEQTTHTDDLRNVREGDTVTVTTTEGETFDEVECAFREVHHADPRSGEIRETTLWSFDVGDKDLTVSIVEGLKSSEDDPDFPLHKGSSLGVIGKADGWTPKGHFESLQIHGKMEA